MQQNHETEMDRILLEESANVERTQFSSMMILLRRCSMAVPVEGRRILDDYICIEIRICPWSAAVKSTSEGQIAVSVSPFVHYRFVLDGKKTAAKTLGFWPHTRPHRTRP